MPSKLASYVHDSGVALADGGLPMSYRVLSGRIPADATRRCGTLPAVLDVQLQEDFDTAYPALLLLFELVEISQVLLTETDEDWYVGAPDPDGHRSAVWLEKH